MVKPSFLLLIILGCIINFKTCDFNITILFLCRKERDRYCSHRSKARSNPDKCVTIIIDGMDQSKCNLPNTKLIAKSTSSLWKLLTHITGLLVHTQSAYGKLAYGFVDLLLWPHDCNLVITLLTKVLWIFKRRDIYCSDCIYRWTIHAKKTRIIFSLLIVPILVHLKIFHKLCSK